MKPNQQLFLPLLVIAPLLLLGFFPIAPRPVQLALAWQRAVLAQENGASHEAAGYYRQVIDFLPGRVDLWNRIGALEFAAGEYDQAVQAYQKAAEHKMITAAGLLELGDSYQQQGDLTAARGAWVELADLPQVDPQQYAAAVERLRSTGDLAKTLVVARRWHEADPQSRPAAWLTGLLLAPDSLTKSARALAAAGGGEGREAESARRLLEVLGQAAIQPDPAYRQMLIGQRLADLGQWDVAERAFQNATSASPDYAEAWAFLGEARQNLNKDGWTDLLRAKTLSPESDIVLTALTLYWNRQSKPNVALSYLRKLAANHPQDGAWQVEIGDTLARAGDLVAAMQAYQRATEIEPESPQHWRALAIFSATYGFDFLSYSQPAIERALALSPDDPLVLDAAGWVYLTNGDLKKAEQFLQQALVEDGEFAAAQLHLAQVYLAGNRYSEASPLLQAAAAHPENAAVALQAQRLLDKHFPGQ